MYFRGIFFDTTTYKRSYDPNFASRLPKANLPQRCVSTTVILSKCAPIIQKGINPLFGETPPTIVFRIAEPHDDSCQRAYPPAKSLRANIIANFIRRQCTVLNIYAVVIVRNYSRMIENVVKHEVLFNF